MEAAVEHHGKYVWIPIERAKGVLMKEHGLGEADAYHAMRKLAMSRSCRVAEVAQSLLDAPDPHSP